MVQPDLNVDLVATHSTVSLDPDAFDVLIRSQGVQFVHYRAMMCPIGKTDRYDIRHTHPDHSDCSNGFLYVKAGCITGSLLSNGDRMDQIDNGLLDAANATCTLASMYDDTETRVDVMQFDRMYLKQEEILVPHRQIVQAHETGHDRLDFKAVTVTDLIDADGNSYQLGDFEIVDGQIVWQQGGLAYNLIEKKGMVYTIRFMYRPYWYVKNLLHQIRVAQVQGEDGREVRRMPQQIALQREFIFEKEQKNQIDPDSARIVEGPEERGFGAR